MTRLPRPFRYPLPDSARDNWRARAEAAEARVREQAEEHEAQLRAAKFANKTLADRVRELETVVESVLQADRSALADHRPKWGLADCVDNDGKPYQSHFLGEVLAKARALLSKTGA